ncbi:MAG: hypothetical protein M0025_12820 [Elusimicrobia bacterium]|nr:hypothetical protein [Elusimicrobiota bacterium]
MSERELAEKFNRELDSLLAGEAPGIPCDPGAMKIAAALAAADLSRGSSARERLRARLETAEQGHLSGLAALFANSYFRAALAAACLMAALMPVIRRPRTSAPAPAAVAARPAPYAGTGAPAAPPSFGDLPPVPRAAVGLRPRAKPDTGLFAAVPMGRLEGERISQFPIRTAGRAELIAPAAVREIGDGNGAGVAWETEGAVFELRRQAITLGDIFEVRSI